MPWDNARPRRTKYDAAHNRLRAQHMAALRSRGIGTCMETVCLYPSRVITADMDLHLCHTPDGRHVLGLGHSKCNRGEAARRARAMQNASRLHW